MIQLTRNRIINLQSIISNILFLDETYLRDVMKVSENYFWMFVFPSNSRRVANISHRKAARRLAIICHWYLYRGEKETEEKYDREATYREGRSVTANSTEKKEEEKKIPRRGRRYSIRFRCFVSSSSVRAKLLFLFPLYASVLTL